MFNNKNLSTQFIKLNTSNCTACWQCLTACSNNVLGKVNLFFHKHAIVKNGDNCTGCLKCLRSCNSNAYTFTGKKK